MLPLEKEKIKKRYEPKKNYTSYDNEMYENYFVNLAKLLKSILKS